MKTYRMGLALALASLLFGACTTVPPDPDVIRTSGRVGGQTGTFVDFEAKKIDERTYEIVAYGRASLPDNQYVDAWIWMANKVAAGRPYEKKINIGSYDYEGSGQYDLPKMRSVGTKITGRIILK